MSVWTDNRATYKTDKRLRRHGWQQRRLSPTLAIVLVAGWLVGCGPQAEPLAMPPEKRHYDSSQLLRGEAAFKENCASCHGSMAEGASDWRRRDQDDRFPPPPLDGTGHAWHHPLAQLRDTITSGGPAGQSNMPAWGSTLSPEEIDDVIAWFQSLWPDPIYEAWYGIEQRARQRQ